MDQTEANAKFKRAYGIFIAALAVVSVINIVLGLCSVVSLKGTIFGLIDTIILGIFIVDYIVRFIIAPKKWRFVKTNLIDLLSIIPYTLLFSFFRIFRLLRVFAAFGRLHSRSKGFFKTNGFGYMLFITLTLIRCVKPRLNRAVRVFCVFQEVLWLRFA